ncbi:NADAR family protein [Pseudoalteromonas marina]|uniref:NADAR family protein n=1 Tax=Pseudoalteromonas marina TaxID=267375 RepID=A0ABT9FGF6_9GAMM|nr:NADAR family protein [Pseudoalteromonas marina]MDP2565826.1 NADAR family protein [Pseudoalteromonas marina]
MAVDNGVLGVAGFSKVNCKWGEFSNMHAGFPIKLASYELSSSEALYQIMRFTERMDVQDFILQEKRPMAVKFISRAHIEKSRSDFNDIRVPLMSWVVRLKFAQHYDVLHPILMSTEELDIIEISSKDSFWGAKYEPYVGFRGLNVLGKIYMELRILAHDKPKSFFDKVVCPPELKLGICGETDLDWSRFS